MPLGRTPSKIDQNRSVMPISVWVDFGHFCPGPVLEVMGSNPGVNLFSKLQLSGYPWVSYTWKGCQINFQVNPMHMTGHIRF